MAMIKIYIMHGVMVNDQFTGWEWHESSSTCSFVDLFQHCNRIKRFRSIKSLHPVRVQKIKARVVQFVAKLDSYQW
jgi:hypothetical protein